MGPPWTAWKPPFGRQNPLLKHWEGSPCRKPSSRPDWGEPRHGALSPPPPLATRAPSLPSFPSLAPLTRFSILAPGCGVASFTWKAQGISRRTRLRTLSSKEWFRLDPVTSNQDWGSAPSLSSCSPQRLTPLPSWGLVNTPIYVGTKTTQVISDWAALLNPSLNQSSFPVMGIFCIVQRGRLEELSKWKTQAFFSTFIL